MRHRNGQCRGGWAVRHDGLTFTRGVREYRAHENRVNPEQIRCESERRPRHAEHREDLSSNPELEFAAERGRSATLPGGPPI